MNLSIPQRLSSRPAAVLQSPRSAVQKRSICSALSRNNFYGSPPLGKCCRLFVHAGVRLKHRNLECQAFSDSDVSQVLPEGSSQRSWTVYTVTALVSKQCTYTSFKPGARKEQASSPGLVAGTSAAGAATEEPLPRVQPAAGWSAEVLGRHAKAGAAVRCTCERGCFGLPRQSAWLTGTR